MKVYKINNSFTNVPKIKEKISLCLGYFDGVHIAHQKLIIKAKVDEDNSIGVITFAYNFKRDSNLTSLDIRINLFKALGIDYVFVLPFSKQIKNMTREEFINKFFNKFNISSLYMGEDFKFGKNRLGDAKFLKQYYRVIALPFIKHKKKKISSYEIASLIKEGNITEANYLLGRAYQIKGKVIEGFKKGRTLNFPTANVEILDNYVCPKYGVYKVIVYALGIPRLGIANVGIHPTINKLTHPLIETHILNYEGDLYGKEIYIEFIEFIRSEKKFKTVKELIKQINKDIKSVKTSS